MAKYRKKPVIVEAEKYREGLEDGWCVVGPETEKKLGESLKTLYKRPHMFNGTKTAMYEVPYINTLEGKLYISEGDWIITGVKGERYPIKPDIFKQTYEPVEEETENNQPKKYSKESIEAARKRLDMSSRGSDEEYWGEGNALGKYEIQIDGCIDVRNNPVSIDEFWDKFIDWIEANQWYFGGSIGPAKSGEEE